jgi:hypothetical protein
MIENAGVSILRAAKECVRVGKQRTAKRRGMILMWTLRRERVGSRQFKVERRSKRARHRDGECGEEKNSVKRGVVGWIALRGSG